MRTVGPSIPDDARGAAVALGKFDGVHAGHQSVIASARAMAEQTGAALGATVFEPSPFRFFNPDAPPMRLQTPAQRARVLSEYGVAEVFEIEFDAALAATTPREFSERVLHDLLGVSHVSVGGNFRFGHKRTGNPGTLAEFGKDLGFTVEAAPTVESRGAVVSSTAIREALRRGETEAATTMLTRPWAIEGEVLKGFQRGRDFGFPTANIALGEYLRPRLGVYGVRVDLGDGVLLPGVASIGVNPTVGALPEPVLEAHLLDFSGDLYGKTIEVEIAAFLRDEAKFEDVDAMKTQMKQDARDARAALARLG